MPYLPRNEKIYAFEHIQQLFYGLNVDNLIKLLGYKITIKKTFLLVYDNLKDDKLGHLTLFTRNYTWRCKLCAVKIV